MKTNKTLATDEMGKKYQINESGNISTFDSLEAALRAAWDMAKSQAEWEGIDPEELDQWGDADESGYGVCPEGDTGADWPTVKVVDRKGRTPYDEYYMQG